MKKLSLLIPALLLASYLSTLHAAQSSPDDIKGYAPVSVSSANYRETPRDTLLKLSAEKSAINPAQKELKPLADPRHFIFLPGDIYESDLTYEQVCALLTPALAKKNYINAADPQGLIREPAKVTTVLRVNYGQRIWRLPTVRTEHITWRDGVVPRDHDARGIRVLGGERVWDARAGGNDDALSAAGNNESNGNSFGWGPSNPGTSGVGLTSTTTTVNNNVVSYEGSRDFNLIVIDAFDYAELKSKGKDAKRLWTTFVAAPVNKRGEKFSENFATLLKAASPFWGETSTGLQVYTDARAKVEIGEAVEVRNHSIDDKK